MIGEINIEEKIEILDEFEGMLTYMASKLKSTDFGGDLNDPDFWFFYNIDALLEHMIIDIQAYNDITTKST